MLQMLHTLPLTAESAFKSGLGNLFTTTGRMKCALSLAGRKINSIHSQILPLSNYEEE